MKFAIPTQARPRAVCAIVVTLVALASGAFLAYDIVVKIVTVFSLVIVLAGLVYGVESARQKRRHISGVTQAQFAYLSMLGFLLALGGTAAVSSLLASSLKVHIASEMHIAAPWRGQPRMQYIFRTTSAARTFQQGMDAMMNEEWEQASDFFERVTLEDPGSWPGYYGFALCKAATGNHRAAADATEKALACQLSQDLPRRSPSWMSPILDYLEVTSVLGAPRMPFVFGDRIDTLTSKWLSQSSSKVAADIREHFEYVRCRWLIDMQLESGSPSWFIYRSELLQLKGSLEKHEHSDADVEATRLGLLARVCARLAYTAPPEVKLQSLYESLGAQERAIEAMKRSSNPDDEALLDALNNKVVTLDLLANSEPDTARRYQLLHDAHSLMTEVARKRRDRYGADDDRTRTSDANLAVIEHRVGRSHQAAARLQAVLSSYRRAGRSDSAGALAASAVLASIYESTGQFMEAIAEASGVVRAYSETRCAGDPDLLAARALLGRLYFAIDDCRAARKITGMLWASGSSAPLGTSVDRLAEYAALHIEALRCTGRVEEAKGTLSDYDGIVAERKSDFRSDKIESLRMQLGATTTQNGS